MEFEDREWASLWGTAYHEAGHAVALKFGTYPQLASAVGLISTEFTTLEFRIGRIYEGYTRTGFDEDASNSSNSDYLEFQAIVHLAGRAAERKFFGFEFGFDYGAGSDLRKARKIAGKLASDKSERRALMRSFSDNSRDLLETHWTKVEAVAEALTVEKTLDGSRFMEIVEAFEELAIEEAVNSSTKAR